jgi:branched-chain amino acid aminotransferase
LAPDALHATVNINGRIHDSATACIPVFDHGFLYGEGVYETLRTYGRRPFLFDRHAARLRRSAARIALPVPGSDDDLRREVGRTLDARGESGEAYIRILLTRGVGDLTYRPSACPTPTLVVLVKAFTPQPDEVYERGVTIALVDVRRNHRDTVNPMIKSNNLLNNALAMQQAYARGADEALMCNLDGYLVECAQSNIFLVRHGELLTPPLADGLLPGITRSCVLEIAASVGIPAMEVSLPPSALGTAQEAFLTGTTREVTPVVAVDDRRIGTGVPGPVTRRLLAEFRRLTTI